MLNPSQINGVIDRLVTAAVMFAVGKGWLTSADAANFIALGVAIAAAAYGYWVNRSSNLATRASQIPSNPPTVVITDATVAAAAGPQVHSNDEMKAVTK